MASAFSDKDSHLGTTALLVSLAEVIFPQICAGPPPPLLRSVLERHLLWRPDILAHLLEVASSCLPLDTSASLHNHTALPEIRAPFATSLRPPKREPHQSWPCSLLLVTLTPAWGWGWGQGTPGGDRKRLKALEGRTGKGPPQVRVPVARLRLSQESCLYLMEESTGDSVRS